MNLKREELATDEFRWKDRDTLERLYQIVTWSEVETKIEQEWRVVPREEWI